ncbi:multidrug efflux SMR transporter [Eggerthellaceae bacterium zg-1084]|uniref:Multidrug efflux SMR transporter n=1 Tax=Berryella wangjianweii TaxID=2734634 RepID=A0A6M8J873_9ACTN|nr:multidrug efflux SMR transporter [Berryella wangjianweii]NPD30827.1 multidrug efflux SMR transporter [Berryella wangjianweii]NPD31694.1 multidrug efflux SMR transporter [Eggerthellaceae bacterium zg-997]QKF07698.1 multidrug efflux SMR transporter [Berryella wangjianweii]
MAWIMMLCSVICETFADVSMKMSQGFRRKRWIPGIAVGYLASFYLMSQVLSALPLGLAYAVWSGAGIVMAAIAGRLVWRERFNARKLAGMALIVAGVTLLRIGA